MEPDRKLLPIYIAALAGMIVTTGLAQPATYLNGSHLAEPDPRLPTALQIAIVVMALFVLVRHRRIGRRSSLVLAWLGTGVSLTLLLATTPFTSGSAHLIATLANIAVLIALTVYLIYNRRGSPTPAGRAIEGLTTAGLALGFTFLASEAIFAAVPSSHAVGYTLSAKLWYERYWTVRNHDGYRDLDHESEPGRPIFMLGDSFVAGEGISHIADRMSDLLNQWLAPRYRVYNLGRLGSDSRDEYRRLLEQIMPPAGVILVYYTNDIERACRDAGRSVASWSPYADVPGWVQRVIRRSYFLDFLYWRFPHADLAPFESSLEACYTDSRALSIHLKDLRQFVTYAHEHSIRLLVVVFPHLVETATTRRLIDPVVQSFRDLGVRVLDVAPMLEPLAIPQRIVNNNDAHPSVRVNRLVAESLVAVVRTWEVAR